MGMMDTHTECDSQDGVTVSLIEGMIANARVIASRSLSSEAVRQALIDFRCCEAVLEMLAHGRPFHQETLLRRRDELVKKGGYPVFARTPEEEVELKSIRREIQSWPTSYFPEEARAMDSIREAAALLDAKKGHP